jgi:hypothetical protein
MHQLIKQLLLVGCRCLEQQFGSAFHALNPEWHVDLDLRVVDLGHMLQMTLPMLEVHVLRGCALWPNDAVENLAGLSTPLARSWCMKVAEIALAT